ncbi:9233_t:CDS:2 [Funneliformis mosseae]|uniref:9233_t:CDS:1 n=1 Tax=Funneliformis mosseae TaxID=27381 RepID=A0A9N8VEN3_FUNMO|nr:9233_t:CDS:2 [Funneliformis mosseae]
MASATETNTAAPNMTSRMSDYFTGLKQKMPTSVSSKVDYGVERARSIATGVSTDLQKTAEKNNVNSFLPSDVATEVQKAAKILNSFTEPEKEEGGLESVIPKDVFKHAKGLAVFTAIKAGFFWSGRVGSGLVVAKRPDESWSCPSLINIGGLGFGAQLGADVTDFLIVLNTDDAVKAFTRGENLTLGGNLSVSAGPVGFGQEYSGSLYDRAALYSYSKSKGLFAGVSVQGTIIMERKDANRTFYGIDLSAEDILCDRIEIEKEQEESLKVLYDAIKKAEEREH